MIKSLKGMMCFRVDSGDNSYIVDYLDGKMCCECALKYSRGLETDCKHKREVRKWLEVLQ